MSVQHLSEIESSKRDPRLSSIALIAPGFKGQIAWGEVDNRSFLRIAHGYLRLVPRDGEKG